MIIKPYGRFEMVKIGKPSTKNCKLCWFGMLHSDATHCPEGYPCVIDGIAYVFIKIPEKLTNI